MARLHKRPKQTGTRNGICVYQMGEHFYMRLKSSLSSERVKEAPEFENTRQYSNLLSRASKLASPVYQGLSAKKKKKYSSQFLTGQAMRMLKNGVEEGEVVERLREAFF